jgi:cytochrome c oxidase subunit 3
LTIIGGAIFVGSQAWEWKNFIKGEYGALETRGGQILQFVDTSSGKRAAIQEFAIGIETDRSTHQSNNGIWYSSEKALPTVTLEEVKKGFIADENLVIRTQQLNEKGKKTVLSRAASMGKLNEAIGVVEGANLIHNEYGNRLFADFFFFITGFHGFHVFSGVVINIIIFFNVILGTYERRGHYEMVEKVGLYWHFVDLVWVFVFTFFYLV